MKTKSVKTVPVRKRVIADAIKPTRITLNSENSAALRVTKPALGATGQKRFEEWAVNQAVEMYCGMDSFPKKELLIYAEEKLSK